ncbi:Flagellar L-ring protein [Buchnera aphidicola (Periphyllus testudinaceus)]|uniref:flagellar basal body L-ring protein FlgH n=1 Tax=Buchnera aphidicola TaxID=9 RepID=UPI003463B487
MLNFFLFIIKNIFFFNIIFCYNPFFFTSNKLILNLIYNNNKNLYIKKKNYYKKFNNKNNFESFFEHSNHSIKVGDLITVILNENIQEKNINKTKKKKNKKKLKKKSFNLKNINIFNKNLLFKKKNYYKKFKQDFYSHKLKFQNTITVIVKHVLKNGLLKVFGKKIIFLNNKNQFIKFSGIINPLDVNKKNVINSNKVINIKIKFFCNKKLKLCKKKFFKKNFL